MVAHKKRMGSMEKDFGEHGSLTGTDAQLEKYEELLVKEGYRVEYYVTRGVKKLHYFKEHMYDAVIGRQTGHERGPTTSAAERVSSFVGG